MYIHTGCFMSVYRSVSGMYDKTCEIHVGRSAYTTMRKRRIWNFEYFSTLIFIPNSFISFFLNFPK